MQPEHAAQVRDSGCRAEKGRGHRDVKLQARAVRPKLATARLHGSLDEGEFEGSQIGRIRGRRQPPHQPVGAILEQDMGVDLETRQPRRADKEE